MLKLFFVIVTQPAQMLPFLKAVDCSAQVVFLSISGSPLNEELRNLCTLSNLSMRLD